MGKEKRTRKITVRLTLTEYQKLEDKVKGTTSSELSHYVRSVLLDRPVVVKYRNMSLDAFMEEFIAVKQELNAIGNNYNQAVKKLHILKQIPEFRQWIQANEMLHQKFCAMVSHIEQRIEKISEQWLQE